MSKMTRIAVVALAALVLAPAATGHATAKVDQVRASTTGVSEDGFPLPVGGSARIPAGSEKMYITFDYSGAAREEIGVEIKTGGLLIFKWSRRLSGSGSTAVEATGVRVFQEVVGQLDDYAGAVKDNLALARTSGNREYIQSTAGNVNLMRTALDLLGRTNRQGDIRAMHDSLDGALDKLDAMIADLPPGANADAVKALAGQMDTYAAQASEAVDDLESFGESATSVSLPETGAERAAALNVNITIGGSPSYSGELWITDQGVADPSPTTASGATAGPSQPTRTAAPGTGGTIAPTPTTASAGRSNTPNPTSRTTGSTGGQSGAAGRSTASANQSATTSAGRATSASSGAGAAFPTVDQPVPIDAGAPGAEATSAASTAADSGASPAEPTAVPEAVATWTLPASSAAGGNPTPATDAEGVPAAPGGSGPNLAVLGFGAMILIAIGVWLRRRM